MVVSSTAIGAREGALGLGHHERCARHALDAAGDHQVGIARPDRARGGAQRVESRPAEPVDGRARHFQRQSGQQRAHARDVPVVFAGLVGAAVDHVGDGLPVDARVARHQRGQRNGAQVVGANAGERAAVAAEGGANGVADEGVLRVMAAHMGKEGLVAKAQMRASSARASGSPMTGAASSSSLPPGRHRTGAAPGSPLRSGCRWD